MIAPPPPKEEQDRANTTQGAYDAMGAVNRQPWYPQGRGSGRVSGTRGYFTGLHGAAQTQAPGVCLGADNNTNHHDTNNTNNTNSSNNNNNNNNTTTHNNNRQKLY
jgi:hypothetical protein